MATDTPFVKGVDRLKDRFSRIKDTIRLPALVESAGQLLLRRTINRFDKEVAPDGKPWPPLDEETVKVKRLKGFGDRRMLVRTGKLRNSIRLIRGGLSTFAINTGVGVRIGIQDRKLVPIARAHNYGTDTIPARRFLGISRLDVASIDGLLRRKGVELGNA